jgi:serine/threonine-protein kinase RsbW
MRRRPKCSAASTCDVSVLAISLRNERAELTRLAVLVEQFGAQHHLSDDVVMNVNLVLDEIVANVIRYAHLGGEDRIDVRLALDRGAVAIDVDDPGVAFNPLDAPPPNLDAPIDERRPGGLGIHIVKSLAETVSYRRADGRNRFRASVRVDRI